MSSASEGLNSGGPLDIGDFTPPAGPTLTPLPFTDGATPTKVQGGDTLIAGNGSFGPYTITFPQAFTALDAVIAVQGTGLSFDNTWLSIDTAGIASFNVIFGAAIAVGRTPRVRWIAYGR